MRYDALIRRLPTDRDISGAEIGVWEGATSYALLRECENIVKHYLVDAYKQYDDVNKDGEITGFGKPIKEDRRVLRKARQTTEIKMRKFKKKAVMMWVDSKEAAKAIEDKSLDYVFIDAEHTYDAVKSDIEAWLPKVKNGGIICGHNYKDVTYKGVTEAVQFFFDIDDIEEDEDWTWFVIINRNVEEK